MSTAGDRLFRVDLEVREITPLLDNLVLFFVFAIKYTAMNKVSDAKDELF